jgi:uncharacterized membrane protein SpoIIM required for sporulation
MNVQRWIAARADKWQKLESLLQQVEKRGVKSLSATEITTLASLYRSVAADLARAQTNSVGDALLQELQALTTRAYTQVYRGSNRQELANLLSFYRWELPRILRVTWVYTAIAAAIGILGYAIAAYYSQRDPSFISLVLPESLIAKVREDRALWMGSILGTEPTAASNIMVNNISVSFRAVAGGIGAGLYTVFLLFYNGLHIGAAATLVGQYGLSFPFWAFVFPHGSLEIPAIFLAGGAGLLIARAILWPAPYRPRDALRIYGIQAAKLVMGIVPLLLIAGTIEGFISPQPAIPGLLKYAIGTLIFVLFLLYSLRRPAHQELRDDF